MTNNEFSEGKDIGPAVVASCPVLAGCAIRAREMKDNTWRAYVYEAANGPASARLIRWKNTGLPYWNFELGELIEKLAEHFNKGELTWNAPN